MTPFLILPLLQREKCRSVFAVQEFFGVPFTLLNICFELVPFNTVQLEFGLKTSIPWDGIRSNTPHFSFCSTSVHIL